MKVVIIDYGVSNLGSIKQAAEVCGGEVIVADDPKELNNTTHVILPGVGSFRDGMKNLLKENWLNPIIKVAIEDKIPFLGICLGMQLLGSKGFENGETDGLDLIPGEIKKFETTNPEEKIPHVGWNEVNIIKENNIFNNIADSTDFYFVHSYHFIPKINNHILSTTPYCGQFVSAIRNGNIYGTQFHPEKSQRPGLQILTNFLNL